MRSSSSTSADAHARRAVAPVHPPAPEARIRYACVRLLLDFHAELKAALRPHAAMYRATRGARADAGDDPLSRSILAAMADRGRYLLRDTTFPLVIARETRRTAQSVNEQTGLAVGLANHDPDLTDEERPYVEGVIDRMDEEFDDMMECSAELLAEWAQDGDLDEEDLDQMLDTCGEKRTRSIIPWLVLMFGWLFGRMVKASQVAAGVDTATWITRRDERVRPAHAELDGVEFSWEGPAPLVAEKSSNGQPCFPGDDPGCRCVGAPVPPV